MRRRPEMGGGATTGKLGHDRASLCPAGPGASGSLDPASADPPREGFQKGRGDGLDHLHLVDAVLA